MPRLADCFSGGTSNYCNYYWWRPEFGWHIGASLVAVSIAIVQLWLGVTGRTRRLHRVLGRIFLAGLAIGGFGSFALLIGLAHENPLPYSLGIACATLAWMGAAAFGYRAARRRDYASHRMWMIRCYVIMMLFATFRTFYWPVQFFLPDWFKLHEDGLANVLGWASWCLPLLVLEIYHSKSRRHAIG